MILGICTSMNSRGSNDVGLDQAEYSKKLGLDYLELPAERIMRMSDSRFEGLKKDLSEGPLPCLACNSYIDQSVRLLGRDFDKDKFENYINRSLERIASLGAKKVVFGSARARNVPSYLSMEEGRAQLIERIKFMAQAAERHNIELELEHLNRIESNILNTFEETVLMAKQLNLPNVKSIFDYYHFAVSGEREDLIKESETWIGHIHFACTLERKMPDLEEAKKLESLLKILRDCSYDGTFSIEAFFPGFEMDNMQYKSVVDYIRGQLG